MSELVGSYPVAGSFLCQSIENGWLSDTLSINSGGTILVSQSMTFGRDIKGSIPIFYLEPQEEGGFVAFSRDYPGAVGQGETAEEAIADIEEAIRLLKEVFDEDKASQQK